MALKLPIEGPGGFKSAEGYRKAAGIMIDLTANAIAIRQVDYVTEERRRKEIRDSVNPLEFQIATDPQPRRKLTRRDALGDPEVFLHEAMPGYADLMERPIGEIVPGATAETTFQQVVSALIYGFLKTREMNAGAEDV